MKASTLAFAGLLLGLTLSNAPAHAAAQTFTDVSAFARSCHSVCARQTASRAKQQCVRDCEARRRQMTGKGPTRKRK